MAAAILTEQDWNDYLQSYDFESAWTFEQQIDIRANAFSTAEQFRARLDVIEPVVLELCCTLVGFFFPNGNLRSKLGEIRDRWLCPEPVKLHHDLQFLQDWQRSIPAPQAGLKMWLVTHLGTMPVVQEYAYLSECWKRAAESAKPVAKKSKQLGSPDIAVQRGLQSLLEEMTGMWLEHHLAHGVKLFTDETTTLNEAQPNVDPEPNLVPEPNVIPAPVLDPVPTVDEESRHFGFTDIPTPDIIDPRLLLGYTNNPHPELAAAPTPIEQQIYYTWREAVDNVNERHLAERQQNLDPPKPSPFRTPDGASKFLPL